MKKGGKAAAKAADKESVNKSQMIRDIRTKNPSMKVTEIVASMKAAGHPVSQALVYQAMRAGGGKKRGRKPGSKKAVVVAKASSAGFKADLFSSLQSFVSAAGSPAKAMAILKVFCE